MPTELGVKDMTRYECIHSSVGPFPCVCMHACVRVCVCVRGVLIIKFNKKLVDYQNKDLCCACSLELLLRIPFLNRVRENAGYVYPVGLVREGQIQVHRIRLGVRGYPAGDKADMLSLESIMEGRSSEKRERPFQNLEEKPSELAELEHCRARPR